MIDVDPEDPAQTLDDTGQFHIHPLEIEIQPEAEASEDLDIAVAENNEERASISEAERAPRRDTGDLYGVRTPHAQDRDLGDGDDEDGENWLEELDERSVEGGPLPEEEVVVIDDSDEDHRGHSATERDRPVADKGSGGPGGL